MFNVTDTWPLITVKTQGTPAEDVITTPAKSPFRFRLVEYGSLAIAWDLLNGRFVRRPPFHRTPRPKFESKQRERLDASWSGWAGHETAGSSSVCESNGKIACDPITNANFGGEFTQKCGCPRGTGWQRSIDERGFRRSRLSRGSQEYRSMTRRSNLAPVAYNSAAFHEGFQDGQARKPPLDEPPDPAISDLERASYCEAWLIGSSTVWTPGTLALHAMLDNGEITGSISAGDGRRLGLKTGQNVTTRINAGNLPCRSR